MKKSINNKKNRKFMDPRLPLICILSVFLVALIGLLLWLEATQVEQPDGTSADTSAAMGTIQTSYGTLSVPAEYAACLNLDLDQPDRIRGLFLRGNGSTVPVFDIIFDDSCNVIGCLNREDGSCIDVSLVIFSLEFDGSWDTAEQELAIGAQEAVNEIIAQLSLIDKIMFDQTQDQDLMYETPYCTVYYPGMWRDKVIFREIPGTGYCLELIAVLDEGREYPIGSIFFGSEGDVGVWSLLLEDGSWIDVGLALSQIQTDVTITDEDRQLLDAMQEDINYLLGRLPIQEKLPDEFVPQDTEFPTEPAVTEPFETVPMETEPAHQATDPTQPSDSTGDVLGNEIVVETPVIDLQYPSAWEKYLDVEVSGEAVYTAAFYAVVDGHPRQHLFTITLDPAPGAPLGTIQGRDGKEYNVHVYFAEFEPDESWSEADRDVVIAMQEDINYLLQRLLG